MFVANVLQIIGLVLDIIGFSFLVWEVGFSHRLEILSNYKKQIAAPDIEGLTSKADFYRDTKLKELAEIKKQKHPAWKMHLGEAIVKWQIERRYKRIEREKLSYDRCKKLAALPHADAMFQRRKVFLFGALLVFAGFSSQLIGTIINLSNITS